MFTMLATISMTMTMTMLLPLLLGVSPTASAAATDLFSSNVVTLTSSNWKEHVVDNPHMVLVNICRKG